MPLGRPSLRLFIESLCRSKLRPIAVSADVITREPSILNLLRSGGVQSAVKQQAIKRIKP